MLICIAFLKSNTINIYLFRLNLFLLLKRKTAELLFFSETQGTKMEQACWYRESKKLEKKLQYLHKESTKVTTE